MITKATKKIRLGQALSSQEAEAAMEQLLSGDASEMEICDLLEALRNKGETVEELVGFARAMRRHAEPIFPAGKRPLGPMVDTCGPGGSGKRTFNISTAAAFVAAGAGVRVAKHGNRSVSSRCGSADVLEALGVNIDLEPVKMGEAIATIGIGFLYAPRVHTAMRHSMPARRRLGGRTVFNLLGPLTNPAGASAQVSGVSSLELTDLLAQALALLGTERAFVVHGADGLDEISLSTETHVAEVRDGAVTHYTIQPKDFELQRTPLSALEGGDAAENARLIRGILEGAPGPRREIVIANAAAALVAAGAAAGFREGAQQAAEAIDSGAARAKLESLVAFTCAQGSAS